jgi:hypothetical protein
VTKSNSRRPAPTASKSAPPAAAPVPVDPDSPPLPPTGKQKLALAVMSLAILGWLAFLAAMALKK